MLLVSGSFARVYQSFQSREPLHGSEYWHWFASVRHGSGELFHSELCVWLVRALPLVIWLFAVLSFKLEIVVCIVVLSVLLWILLCKAEESSCLCV